MKKIKAYKPVNISDRAIMKIAKGLEEYFKENIFNNIFEILDNKKIVFNEKTTLLLEAIRLGNVWYKDGAFRTEQRFSNAISKELESLGAVFKNGAYYIKRSLLPYSVEQAISLDAIQTYSKITAIKFFLDYISASFLDKELLIEGIVDEVFTNFQKELIESTNIPIIEIVAPTEDIEISEELATNIQKYWEETDKKAYKLYQKWEEKKKKAEENPNDSKIQREAEKARQELATFRQLQQAAAPNLDLSLSKEIDQKARKVSEDYVYNMKYWVKKWEVKEIAQMRKDVLEMTKKGTRLKEIKEYFKKRWQIAQRKAEFLARNECGLASSTIKAVHYQEMGCRYFLWLKSVAKEKRLDHLELAKKVNNQFGLYGTNLFRFDNPPVIDPKTGQKGLPKQIYNCQCDFVGVYNPEFYYRKYESEQNFIKRITNSIKTYCEQCTYPVWKYKKFNW